jgi:hypothetical protein
MGAAPVVAYLEGLLHGENATMTGTRYRQASQGSPQHHPASQGSAPAMCS